MGFTGSAYRLTAISVILWALGYSMKNCFVLNIVSKTSLMKKTGVKAVNVVTNTYIT